MGKNQLFATKSLKVLLDEMAGEHRLKRVLGPVTLTALGIGAVIGAGIFVATVANGWSGYFQSVLLKLGIIVPVALSGAPHKYDQGHILPNVVALHEGAKVTQKVMDDKEAWWSDRTIKPVSGVYWVQKDDK